MVKPYEPRLIMMVAQKPFEAGFDKFCKLVPCLYVDGTLPDLGEFPNDGEVWWMLTPKTERLAEPGRLVVGKVEDAVNIDPHDATRSLYQVQRESARDLDTKDGLELVDLPANSIGDIQDLVTTGFHLPLTHRPAAVVVIRWGTNFYGPLGVTDVTAVGFSGDCQVSFAPINAEMTVYKVDRDEFRSLTKGGLHTIADTVSLTQRRRSERDALAEVRHEIVLGDFFDRAITKAGKRLTLEPIERKLQRFAKQFLTRKKRQEFQKLLTEIEIGGQDAEESEELKAIIGRVKNTMGEQDAVAESVAKALLESGILGEDRIKKAEQDIAGRFVREQSAALQAQIERAISEKREELSKIETDLREFRSRFQKDESKRRAQLEQEIENERAKAGRAMAAEREQFEKRKANLEAQQKLLEGHLGAVTKELREAGDVVVNRFLTIAPFLGMTGLSRVENPAVVAAAPPITESISLRPRTTAFELPGFVSAERLASEGDLNEEFFFRRFVEVVAMSGFTYREIDLMAFHLSVKCCEVTVLGGVAGTGKSSLPALYSKALLGSESGAGRPGCLTVNINPAWMDIRDLLGHVNTLEGRFYPAESGLFQHLIYAQEEYVRREEGTGIYLVCLDEMNLSQVEHYFSDFMMVLERDSGSRVIRCFSPEVIADSCPFRAWPQIRISPAFRFVGTVNFDETTRLLSDRFLDRVNLIALNADSLPDIDRRSGEGFANVQGPMVTWADFERWRKDVALPPDLGGLLDEMRPLLGQMGCPLSPRGYRAICRFVGSALALLSAENAFDLQIAQRVVPKIRSLVTKTQLGAFDELIQLLRKSNTCSFRESMPRLEAIHEQNSSDTWEFEE